MTAQFASTFNDNSIVVNHLVSRYLSSPFQSGSDIHQDDQGQPPSRYHEPLELTRQIWSVKKDQEAENKKKPKMSAAQLRVQKGESESSKSREFAILKG